MAIAIILLFASIAVPAATAGSLLSLGKTDESAALLAGLWYCGVDTSENSSIWKFPLSRVVSQSMVTIL